MSKVYVYTRYSTAEAFENGSSRETQIKKCRNYASIKDLIVDEIIEEQCSGQIPFERREKAYELLRKLKTNDHIICSHLDRFCRNTLSLLQTIQKFKKKKILNLPHIEKPLYKVNLTFVVFLQHQKLTLQAPHKNYLV